MARRPGLTLSFGRRLLLCALALTGCASTSREPAPRAAAEEEARVWRYDVRAAPRARELTVTAELPPGAPALLGVDRFADPYLVDLRVITAGGARRVEARERRWSVPECERGCRLEYRYELARAAAGIDRFGFAAYRGGALLAPPSTFLLHSRDYAGSDRYRFHVTTAPGESFASGVFSARDAVAGSAFEAPAALLFEAPYSGFGRFVHERWTLQGAELRLAVSDGAALAVHLSALRAWIDGAARLAAHYYGRFPVREVAVIAVPMDGADVFAMELGNGGASIVVFLGKALPPEALDSDWTMLHEMFHLGFPTLEREHLWLAEGLATYQGPLARARAGTLGIEQLWLDFMHGMAQGLPGAGDGGLDGASSWGRVYWGGALYCLLADIAIRRLSNGERTLDDAARAIQRAGGDTSVRWSIEQTLARGDLAAGGSTLRDLYATHGKTPVSVDLEQLWRRLGLRDAGGRIEIDESAEWAHVRRALTAPARAARLR